MNAQTAPVSKTWLQYVEAKKSGEEPILPDFSYAGYHYGEVAIPDVTGPIFDVTKFGAVANDDKSDQSAIRAAIAEAEESGGVVLFPAGEFLVNTDEDDGKQIFIRKGHVVLRGAGDGKGGTTIKMMNNMQPRNPEQMYSVPFMFETAPEDHGGKRIAKITAPSGRETFGVTVDDASKLKPGQRVTLSLRSTEAIPDFFAPAQPQAAWKRLFDQGIVVTERHVVRAIEGNKVTFVEPIHVGVDPKFEWTLATYEPIEEIGVEDIRFKGRWTQAFVHHRTALDDNGWSMLEMDWVANSWVRRCTFENVNHAMELESSSNVTVMLVTFTGNRGHFAMHTRGGYGVLGYGCRDEAWFHHGPSVGYQAAGTVYCRWEMYPGQRNDSHSSNPYATLLDLCDGGILYGSGGPIEALPHHMRWYTLWNYHHPTKPPVDTYDFWREGQREAFLRPIIVGIHGYPLKFNEATLELLESNGAAVSPESLYEAQLEMRLGKLPEWLVDAREKANARGTVTVASAKAADAAESKD